MSLFLILNFTLKIDNGIIHMWSLKGKNMKEIVIENLSLEEKVGQMLMFAFHGTEYNEQLDYQLKRLNVGGIIHFARNIDEDVEKVKKLNSDIQKNSKYPVFIGLDQEGGMVTRINNITPFPGAMTLSATRADITDICYYEGCDLKKLGFNMNFAPVADVNNNPLNPVISSRSYSDDPLVVSKYVNEAFKGFEKANILSTLKHFPGHGDVSVDSHLSMPHVDKDLNELERLELLPFERAIENGVSGIMAAHILYKSLDDKYPATLSKKIIKDYLRDKLGYDGLVITDSLTMGAIQANFDTAQIIENCVNAGVDIMMFCGKAELNDQIDIYNTFLKLVETKKIKESTIDEAVQRIIKLKNRYANEDVFKIEEEKVRQYSLELFEKSPTLVKNSINIKIEEDESVLIIFPKVRLSTLVDNETSEYRTLKTYLPNADEIIIDENFENFDFLVQNIKKYDKIIMATLNVKANDYQTKVFSCLSDVYEKTIVVSLRSPYDEMYLKGVKNYICLYEVTRWSLESLAKCLKNGKFLGKLPIKLKE